MATPIVNNDVIEVKYFCQLGNQLGINVRHYVVNAIIGIWDTDILAGSMSIKAGNLYPNLLANDALYFGCTVQVVTTEPVGLPSASRANTLNGAAGATILPCQVSGMVTLRSDLAGRANRGRVYIPFPAAQDSTNSVPMLNPFPTNDYVTRLDALATGLFVFVTLSPALLNLNLQGVIRHRADGTFTRLTTFLSRQLWATQRRRGDYGRPNANPF